MPDEEYTVEGVLKARNSLNQKLTEGHAKIASKDDPAIKQEEKLNESLLTETKEGVELLADHKRDLEITKLNPTARLSLIRQFEEKKAILLEQHRKGLLTPIDN